MPRALANISAESVADVGCGTGDLAAAMCIRCGPPETLMLIDGSQSMLHAASDGLRFIAQTIDTRHALLQDVSTERTYDLVLCAHLIEHIPDSVGAVKDLAEMITPRGHMLLLVSRPHWCNWVIWLRWRHKWFSEAKMRTMAEEAGLETLSCFHLHSGPPRRTSFAYLMRKPAS